jgi:hypothetical protein
VVPEVKHRVVRLQRVRSGSILAFNDQDADFFRLMQIGQGFGKRAGGFPAAVPRHDYVVERCNGFQVVRNQQEMTSGSEKQVFDQAFGLVSVIRPKRDKGVGGTRQRHSGIENFVADHIEPTQDGWPMQLRQALKHRRFWVALVTAALILPLHGGTLLAAARLFGFGAAILLIGENFIQPALIGGAARLRFLLVLIGIFGEMQSFGMVGLFLGPVIMAALLTIWREWIGVGD